VTANQIPAGAGPALALAVSSQVLASRAGPLVAGALSNDADHRRSALGHLQARTIMAGAHGRERLVRSSHPGLAISIAARQAT